MSGIRKDAVLFVGLVEQLTNIQGNNGEWAVTLRYDNYQDGAQVLNADGAVITDCYDLDKSPADQFRAAIDAALEKRGEA